MPLKPMSSGEEGLLVKCIVLTLDYDWIAMVN